MQKLNRFLAMLVSLTLGCSISATSVLAVIDTSTGTITTATETATEIIETGTNTGTTTGDEETGSASGESAGENTESGESGSASESAAEENTGSEESGSTSESAENNEENNDETTEEIEEEINDTADEIDTTAGDLTSDDETEVAEAIETIEENLEEIEDELDEAEKKGNDVELHRNAIAKIKILMVRIKVAQKNNNQGQLVALQKQLRNLVNTLKKQKIKQKTKIQLKAKFGKTKMNVKKIDIQTLKKQKLLSVRWGQVRKPENETAQTTGEKWNGAVSVESGKIKLVNPILFEENDAIISANEEKIVFNSMIVNHFDGVLIKVLPDETGSYENTTITVSFDDHTGLTYTKEDFQAGRYKEEIENGRGVIIEKRIGGVVANEVLQNFRAENRDEIEDLLENIDEEYQDDISGLLQELDEDEQNDFVQKRQKYGAKLDKMMKHLPFVPQAKRTEILAQKLAILAEAENLDEAMEKLNLSEEAKTMLEDVLALIEEYNFDAGTATRVNIRIQRFVAKAEEAGLSEEEIEAEIERLKAETEALKKQAKEQKFTQGIIPFKDTDDGDWFTQYVSYVKNKSIVGGYKDLNGKELGEFRPGNNVTVAEILKMALESAEVGGDESGNPANQNAVSHWAKEYFKKAEDLGLTLTQDTTLDPNKLATRGDVIRLALEVLGISPDAVTSTDFSDVPASHQHADYIQYAKEAGVISGDTGKNTFRPDAPINRAEVAKILQNMIEILKPVADVTE